MEGGRAGDLEPRAAQLVKVAHSESERLIRLINDILDIRKIEAGKLKLRTEELEVSAIVDGGIEGIRAMADQSNIRLSAEIQATGKFFGDRDRLSQVLTNLLSNAIKFSPPGSEIVVRVEKTMNSTWRFSVTDTGPGIPTDQKHKLFGLFQQLDLSDSRPQGGTGLGLAICKAIVEEHQGSIGVDSVVGKGSTFWFELPHAAEVVPEVVVTLQLPAIHTALLVDDDENLCKVLTATLEEQGFAGKRAGSIQEAEELLAGEGNPDVIILDIWLPDGNGLDLMQKLSADGRTEKVPIIILSGKEPQLNTYMNPQLIDWIQKPYESNRLVSALRVAVRRRVSGPARVLVVEDDEPTRALIKQELEGIGVETIEAADGVTAVHLARTTDPDLIVLDLTMPGLDGFQVVEVLRNERSQMTPLIVYTARDLNEHDKQKLTLGLSAHLIKSRASEKELLDTVKSMLNGLVIEKSGNRPGNSSRASV
jgi:DNA-binding response OmpR family regulator